MTDPIDFRDVYWQWKGGLIGDDCVVDLVCTMPAPVPPADSPPFTEEWLNEYKRRHFEPTSRFFAKSLAGQGCFPEPLRTRVLEAILRVDRAERVAHRSTEG